jgi:hypothetical protein
MHRLRYEMQRDDQRDVLLDGRMRSVFFCV